MMVVSNLSGADFTMAFQHACSKAADMTIAKTISDILLHGSVTLCRRG
jgi:hypothetical protein